MTPQQALDLFGDLPPRHIRALFEQAAVVDLGSLPRGLWLGRAGGGTRIFKWILRRVARRDYFAKLLIEDWGVSLLVEQKTGHACRFNSRGAPRIDFPFCINWDTFDYGYHILGQDLPQPPLMMQDEVRALPLADLADVVPASQLERIGLTRASALGAAGAGLMLVGYVSPLGLHRLRGTPFAMVFHRKATRPEIHGARSHVASMRVFDSSPGPRRCRAHEPAAVPFPT